jgi:methylmalonyl-CoA/ethylmalonyl-CoA epimerase
MPDSDIFHFGLLVPDLDAAVASYGSALGLTFGSRQCRCLSVASGDETHDFDLELAFSMEGPPYIELIQAQPNTGVWGADHGQGFHHFGLWVDDLEGRVAELAAAGVRVEAGLSHGGTRMAVYLEPVDLTGTRVELCARPPGPWSPPR